MIRKIISCVTVIVFFNLLLPQTNTNVIVQTEPAPSFSTLLNNWVKMDVGANYMLLKKNNPFWSPNDMYLITPIYMSKILQENDALKANNTTLTNQVAQYVTRLADRDISYKTVVDLYNVGQSRISNLTNQLGFMSEYITMQDKQMDKLFSRQKWGLLGDILLFVGGIIVGGFIVYGGFSIAASIIK